jgi:hypothetical protein
MSTMRLIAVLAYSAAVAGAAFKAVKAPRPESQPNPSTISPSLGLAVEVLRSAERFSAAQVGYAGVTPPEVLAWNVILRNEHADSVFRALVVAPGHATQLYALAGLRFLVDVKRTDPEAYRAAVRALGHSREPVWKTVGCIGSQSPLADLVHEVDEGTWTQEFVAGRLLGKH